MLVRNFFLIFVLTLCARFDLKAASSAWHKHDHVQVQLISESAKSSSKAHWFALRLKPDTGWHVYWRNPGDSGSAPEVRLPSLQGAPPLIHDIIFPIPERIQVGPLTNIGYSHEVILSFALAPIHLEKGPLEVRWLVCEEICIPGKHIFSLPLENADAPQDEQIITAAREQKPRLWPHATITEIETTRTLEFSRKALPWPLAKLDFFPYENRGIKSAAPSISESVDGKVTIALALSDEPATESLAGLLTLSDVEEDGSLKRMALDLAPEKSTTSANQSLLLKIALAFLGGLILNIMPCVLPVLSIKALSLINESQRVGRKPIFGALAYTAGILASMLSLAMLLFFAKSAGSSMGWGFQLQSPTFVAFLIALFFLLSMNFLGIWEPWNRVTRVAGHFDDSGNTGFASQFLSGVFAVLIASPCTGPFMGAALGYALTADLIASLAVFVALGLGFASPFLALAVLPRASWRLPKPGPWMETLRQFFAFPMLATALWLCWVLAQQTSLITLIFLLTGLLFLAFLLWMQRRFEGLRNASHILLVLSAIGLIVAMHLSHKTPQPAESGTSVARLDLGWKPFDAKTFPDLRSKQTVFVDFTAAWCVTCQVNKLTVLNRTDINKAFDSAGILKIRADWTDSNEDIGKVLETLGRKGVPVYALYTPGREEPYLFPELLTSDMIFDQISNLSQPKH